MNKDRTLYFYALVPPKDIREAVTEIKLEFKQKYNSEHALKSPPHITLIPPFKCDEDGERKLMDALEDFAVKEKSFNQCLEGFGVFPPKVIFIKVNISRELEGLYNRFLDHMDYRMGIRSLVRFHDKFSPHMTVAFRDLNREQFYLAKPRYLKRRISFEFEVDGISLLRHNGLHWEIIHESYFGG